MGNWNIWEKKIFYGFCPKPLQKVPETVCISAEVSRKSSAENIWCQEFNKSEDGTEHLYGSCHKNKYFAEDIKLWVLIKL